MNFMTYFPILVGALAFVYFIYPRYEAKFRIRPRIVVETEPNKGITKMQSFIGYSSKNGSDRSDIDERWFIYEFEWKFDLIVRNNSEINAYELQLLQRKDSPNIEFQGKINIQKALKAQEEIVLPFKISKIVECQGKDRESYFNNYPDIFEKISIILQYKNPKGQLFQSVYFFKRNYTSFESVNKNIIKYYWH